MVLALPRGGVPVGYEVALKLHAPLDVLVVRKLGAPGHEELAIGAVSGEVVVLDPDILVSLRVPETYVEYAIQQARAEATRLAAQYRGARPTLNARGQTVVLVDDGAATGSTMQAAIDLLRRQGPARVIVALPTASQPAVHKLSQRADQVICLESPPGFVSVGEHYVDFTPTTNEEVCRLLKRRQSLSPDGSSVAVS